MKPAARSVAAHMSFLLVCLMLAPAADAAESTIARANGNNRRNTEGSVVALRDGTLFAVWSEYYGGARGDSSSRLSAARSADGGITWSDRFTVVDNAGGRNVTSASLLRSGSGNILLFYGVKNSPEQVQFFVRRSPDEAQTWGKPDPVSAEPGYYVMNNARVLQLKDGRILAPMTLIDKAINGDEAFRTVVYFSDDSGGTWRQSKSLLQIPNERAVEPTLFDWRNGEVQQIIRTESGATWYSYSQDRGETWSKAEPWDLKPRPPCTLLWLPIWGGPNGPMFIYQPEFGRHGVDFERWKLRSASLPRDGGNGAAVADDIEAGPDPSCGYQSAIVHDNRILMTYYGAEDGLYDLKFRSMSVPEGYRGR